MRLSRCITSIVWLACVAVVGCATPGETCADRRVQGDVTDIIKGNELAHGHLFGVSVKDTKRVSAQGTTVVERWYVERGDHVVIYTVKLTPSKKGGTDIEVSMPDEDQKKK
jgi:hypothetical protein